MTLRDYLPTDAESLAAVYRDAARNLGRQRYTDAQTRVWALHPEDLEPFRGALSAGQTICAVVDGSPVAFGQRNPADHLAYLYCHSAHARRGYASAILAALEARAAADRIPRLQVEASGVARPFFERLGYQVIEAERPVRHGLEFLRFKMKKALTNEKATP
jgi:putative acetyltransferase